MMSEEGGTGTTLASLLLKVVWGFDKKSGKEECMRKMVSGYNLPISRRTGAGGEMGKL